MHHLENELQNKRIEVIKFLSEQKNKTLAACEIADDLFSLDLTVYSKNYSFESLLYNAFAVSVLDESISLHPEQIRIINKIKEERALIVSAPTSFGKTFCIFEYIAKYNPTNVVLIVPTLALLDEYYKKIIKKYKNAFEGYHVYTNVNEEKNYDFTRKNIFILTHDRVVQETVFSRFERIDLLVIDEVYKLENDQQNDRVLILNMAYYYLSKIASKYVLLAPFIGNIVDYERLEKKPAFYKSNYSPVVNEVRIHEIIDEHDRFPACQEMIHRLDGEKTLVYFPTVTGKYGMYNYVDKVISNEPKLTALPIEISQFINWAKEEIHEEWCVVKALERGYLIHNGQIPVGIRIFQLDQYDNGEMFNKLLCTSTLLEGVNTTAENIIIVKPSRKSNANGECFGAFDFYNLVGRTGRLNKHLIGNAYYIKGPSDVEFRMEDAVRSIRFEILESTNDMDIQLGNANNNRVVAAFLESSGITIEEYKDRIGTRVRFQTAKELFNRFNDRFDDLADELKRLCDNNKLGRRDLISILYYLCEGETESLEVSLVNSLLNRRRPSIKEVVNSTRLYYPQRDINEIISKAIKIKNGYIEHTFYNRVSIIRFFCEKKEIPNELLAILDERVITAIEQLYYLNRKNKKMLLDLGIYERDIDKITGVIGDEYEDAVELKEKLTNNAELFRGISFISRYVINSLR